ncbi:hypothetical protein J3R30DRAFT_3399647 [Lentinula aciculospora]|uniref:Uncharacterized protein n=1 Tax=Lentinula aciculospora TaxID=153920 RepID=A0A9W9DYR7_9AGAR|nr:hypothetical protein J3R30DRAFT_3399647 [Lentinula aciculospora]
MSGTHLYLTCDSEDGMATCWDLTHGNVLNEIDIGRKIIAKSTVGGRREISATSVLVLFLDYDIKVDDSVSSYSNSNVHLTIIHRSPLDPTYRAMYPSCAINKQGLVVIPHMARSIHVIAINVNTGSKFIQEMEVDSVDLVLSDQDLLIILLPFTTEIPCNTDVLDYFRSGFYSSGAQMNSGTSVTSTSSQNAFVPTALHVATGTEQYTKYCFCDFNPVRIDNATFTKIVHQRRLPDLQFVGIPSSGSESGTWGIYMHYGAVSRDLDRGYFPGAL